METINTVVGRYSSPSFVVGCKEPLTFQDFSEMNFHLSGEFLKTNLVCEVDVCVLVPLCSTVSLSIGYILQSSFDKTGREIV